jgi:hypothetical protein
MDSAASLSILPSHAAVVRQLGADKHLSVLACFLKLSQFLGPSCQVNVLLLFPAPVL